MIKTFLVLLAAGILLNACQQNSGAAANHSESSKGEPVYSRTKDPAAYPVFTVADTAHDFGKIKEGDIVAYSFKFKNTGSKDLVIAYASSTCGCTVADYPKQPVKPGEEAYLKVVFNSAGKSGRIEKPVYLFANTLPPQIDLKITGDIIESKQKP